MQSLLQRHGAAVQSGSASAFLADVDRGKAAASYRQAAAAQFTALRALPLRAWSYAVNSAVNDPAPVAAAAARLGAPTTIVHLSVNYQLDRVDPAPVTHDLWWTFVTRHGHVYVAGDSDMAAVGGASWRGPWDFGPIVIHRGSSCLVIGHPASADRLGAIADAVDAAVGVVTSVWGSDWNSDLAVLVPGSSAEFATLGGTPAPTQSGGSGAAPDISAETVFERAEGVDSAARVLVNPQALAALTPVGLGIVLRHEVTHAAAVASTPVGTPQWLAEGLADYVGNLGTGQPVGVAAAELRAEIRRGVVPAQLPSDSDFSAASGLAAVYEQAWLACRLIAARVGPAGLVRFYRQVGASLTTAQVAVESAMHAVLHESLAAFTAQWRAYLVTELR